ncbi:MAG: hypothetical protein Q6L68_05465 [Thermostichus sp. DG02_5_bins_236]
MSGCWLALLQIWLPGMIAHVQQRYLELISEVEQWGVYDPYVGEVLVYLSVIISLGYLAERISFGEQWQAIKEVWRNSKLAQGKQNVNLSDAKETEQC